MSAHTVKRKRHSSRHRKRQHYHDDKRKQHAYEETHNNGNPIGALNIDLAAKQFDSLTKNTKRAQTKPCRNTIDLSLHESGSGYRTRKSCTTTPSIPSRSSRFKKRISAPIIVPQSGSVAAHLDAVSTPYYTNLAPLRDPSPISLKENEDNDLNEDEINEMIRSYRRMSSRSRKSRPRAYSKTKTRRVSQKLFGLIESISTDNGYCLGNGNGNGNGNGYTEEEEDDDDDDEDDDDDADYHSTLDKYGYIFVKLIAKSLQGIVIEAQKVCDAYSSSCSSVIIKITDKELYFNKMSNKNGKSLYVEEDIIKEKKLLMYLTANNPPKELVKFLGFFEDKYRFYVVMENGGNDFFNWIVQCHEWIRAGKISLKQWSLYTHDLMLQILGFIKWLHCSMNVCHLDISLENMLIKNNKYKSDGNGGIRLSRKMQIKVCDFGLAEYFESSNGFLCRKYVGKTHYKAPNVYSKKVAFDARKADIWSLGVSFFMMIIGAPPYKLPIQSDDHYALIHEHNDVLLILKRWGRDHYCNKYTRTLLNAMLNVDEDKRCSIHDISNNLYFKQDGIGMYGNGMKKKRKSKKRKRKSKSCKPSNPIHISDSKKKNKNAHHNIFENLVMSQDDGQLFKYRKRKITST